MTVLALKLSRHANGVSALHGAVSRRMWQPLYRQHCPRKTCRSATSPTASTFRAGSRPRCTCSSTGTSGTDWPERPAAARNLGGDRDRRRRRALGDSAGLKGPADQFVRNRLASQARRREEPDAAIEQAMQALDLNALTIGFARRFATYKRAGLDLAGCGTADRDGQLERSADPDHLRRQGPPRGPHGQGADPEHRPDHPAGTASVTASSSSKITT